MRADYALKIGELTEQQLYPNINSEGEIKSDIEGAFWNIFINGFCDCDAALPLI